MRVAIFLPNWIGDVAMATPTLRALRRWFGPGATLLGIAKPYVAEVLAGTPWLDDQWLYDRHSRNPAQRGWALVRHLRAFRPDVALLLTSSLRAALAAWLSGARERVGYARNGRRLLLTRALATARDGARRTPVSAVDAYLALAYALGAPTASRRLELATTARDELAADQAWQVLGLPPADGVVAMHAGGGWGGTGSAKAWPVESFAELARKLSDERGLGTLVLCGPNERDTAAAIARLADRPNVQSLAELPGGIGLSKACVRRARLMVTTDSGPRHFAAAFETPVVTLFGPTDPRWSHNYQADASDVQHRVPCSPCQKAVCPLGHHQCMRDLRVETVLRAATSLLDATEHRLNRAA